METIDASHASLFNCVLDGGSHTLVVGCGRAPGSALCFLTLGHGYTHGVAQHPFFGTAKAVDSLRAQRKAWARGVVHVSGVRRDRRDPSSSGLVCDFVYEKD